MIMSKNKNNYLHLLENSDILEDVQISKNVDIGFSKKQYAGMLLKKINLKCKNQKQKEFVKLIDENEITICIGDSGVGKSYISIAKSLELLKNPNNSYERIYVITPIVELENENIGALKGSKPGSYDEKIFPFLYSIYYIFDQIIGEENRKKLVDAEIIKPLCITYLRGVNISKSILIGDELQNASQRAVKTILTRIGNFAKFILSGDLNQIDKFKKPEESGLRYAYDHLQGIEGIGFVEFSKDDIVRNPIISKILERF